MNGSSQTSPRTDTVLPELCTPPQTLTLILIGALVALALAVAGATPGRFWDTLGRLALFCEFLMLASAAGVCLLRRPLARYGTTPAMLGLFAILVLLAWGVAEAAWFLLRAYGETSALPGPWAQVLWVGRIVLVAAIVDAMLLRYFYVTAAWRENVRREAASRLEALTARVRPHFLFNTLNTAVALVRDRPEAAEQTLENLAELFRASLGARDARVPLSEELEITERYLEIESLRLGSRLRVEWTIVAGTERALLPPLLLQTLVENAVTHGIEPLAAGGTLSIVARREGGSLQLRVVNPREVGSGSGRHGIGLAGARARLQLAFGGEAGLDIAESGDTFEVRVQCPWVEADEERTDDAHPDRG